jgi:cell division protein FtsI (penicillin-binding protein 3)
MGQEVGVTPLQLVSAVSAIANGGVLHKPRMVRELRRGEEVLAGMGTGSEEDGRRVIRPETAATLRRLMEGVVLNGTGELARLDGWTAGGKTGSAQKIDPATGRYSATQFIASFSGFAPLNSPAIAVLVSLDSPQGPHEGGQVAAPVFKRIAEQVLSYLDVPRDVPGGARVMKAAYRQERGEGAGSLEDFAAVDFAVQPEAVDNESKKEKKEKAETTVVTVAVDEGGSVAAPALAGKTMREVTRECLALGIEPVLVGTGVAIEQAPVAGAKLRHGGKIVVRFGAAAAPAQRENAGTRGGRRGSR